MRALVVSDIHGNVHALNAVLAAATGPWVGGFDALWNLGDAVGYGARPNEVLDRLKSVVAQHKIDVRGNHDRVCCGLSSSLGFNPVAAEAASWTRDHLTPENLEFLREMPKGPIRATSRAMCAHGSPLHEDQYIVSMRDAWTPLQRMETEITFFGHTHVQGGFSQDGAEWEEDRPVYPIAESSGEFLLEVPIGSRHLINPGSVGQPRDGDWRAAFAIYESTPVQPAEATQPTPGTPGIPGPHRIERVTFYRVPYDVEAAQAAIRTAGLPERLAARLASGR